MSPERRRGRFVLRLIVSGVLLGFVLATVPIAEIAKAAQSFDVLFVAPILALHLTGVLIRSWKLHYLSAASGMPMTFRSLVRIYFVGSLAYIFVPSLEVAQVGLIGHEKGRYARAALSVSMDRLSGLVALLAIGAGALALHPNLLESLHPATPLIVMTSLTISLAVLLAGFSDRTREFFWRVVPARFREGSGRVSRGLQSLNDGFRLLSQRKSRIPVLLGLALLFQSASLGIYLLMCRGMSLDVDPSALASVFPLMGLANLFPSILGIGSRDAGFVLALQQIQIQPAVAVTLSVFHLALALYSAAIGWLLLAPWRPKFAPGQGAKVE